MTISHSNSSRAHSVFSRVAASVVAALLAGCDTDTMLRVEDPVNATPGSLDNPAALPIVVAGALGDFQVAYSGSGDDSYLVMVALFSDEFHSSDTFLTRTATDQRAQFPTAQGNTSDATFNRLQAARRSLRDASEAVARFASASDARFGRLRALEGFTYTALGEAFCSAIPFSDGAGGVPRSAGPPISTAQVFDQAVERFDEALAASENTHLASIGKARALQNNARFQEAAAAVRDVPTEFAYFIEHSANTIRQHNPIFSLQSNGRYSLSDREGGNGLDFRSAADPRVPWKQDPVGGFDRSIDLYVSLRYPGFGSRVPLATGVEARLIEAEAALRAGDVATWLAKLNELRANVRPLMTAHFDRYADAVPLSHPNASLAPLSDPGDAAARVDLMFRERGFWLFNTGHRLGDLRRLVRQYGRQAVQVFPVGSYHKGGQYGTDTSFPIPFAESNNPHFSHSSCDPASP
jgi:starch-binding outer membrane protein, SusD/RagB family